MENKPGIGSHQLVVDLNTRLADAEDAETAIAIHEMATWLISQLEDVRQSASELAEKDMKRREVESLKTPVGSAGWTRSVEEQLDENAWRAALAQNATLADLQRRFEAVRVALRQAQKPYMESPSPEFRIR